MAEQPIGPILDGLDITIDLDDGELVENVLVLAKTVDQAGAVALTIANSAGMSWIEQLGLLAAAQHVLNGGTCEHPDDD